MKLLIVYMDCVRASDGFMKIFRSTHCLELFGLDAHIFHTVTDLESPFSTRKYALKFTCEV